MQIGVERKSITEVEADAILLSLMEGEEELSGPVAEVDRAMDGAIRSLIGSGDLSGVPNETVVLYPSGAFPSRRVVVVGLGKAGDLTADRCRQASAAAARRAGKQGAQHLVSAVHLVGSDLVSPKNAAQAAVEGVLLGLYETKKFMTSGPDRKTIMGVDFLLPGTGDTQGIEEGIRKSQDFADAICAARDLVNQPPNYMTPSLLADVACAFASQQETLTCEVLDGDRMTELGMGAIMGVARGSHEPPRFIVMEYKGPDGKASGDLPTIVLVGKGITFDSGGISLKPRDHMEEMKTDMAGAAAVIATMLGAARLSLPLHLVALAPASENLPSGSACKPGDVLTAMNGKTIEIINTDAEGRLILADALCYAARYEPDAVIDVATLTGACVIALGEEVAAGIFSNDDRLCSDLIAAGEFSGEKLWRLPLYEAYRDKIKSDVADMKNTGGRYGGVGTSAVFLKEFVSYPWAHIDIAGMAVSKSDSPYTPKGGTGFAVGSLLSYLTARSEGGKGGER